MKHPKISGLINLYHEFLIMLIFVLGIALPVIIYQAYDLKGRIYLSYITDINAFTGLY